MDKKSKTALGIITEAEMEKSALFSGYLSDECIECDCSDCIACIG